MFILLAHHFPCRGRTTTTFREAALLVISNARRIFDCQRSDFFVFEDVENRFPVYDWKTTFDFFVKTKLVALDRVELPTSPYHRGAGSI